MASINDISRHVYDDGIEVLVAQIGVFGNVNTAIIDRDGKNVVLIDPNNANKWIDLFKKEDLFLTHILITHTHRDHVFGVKKLLKLYPDVELWGHEDSNYPNLFSRVLFQHQNFTHTWKHNPHTSEKWVAGRISLTVTHSPGHAPGHVTFHGHGVYHAGDLLFTLRSGRVDLPGGNSESQWKSICHAREILRSLPKDWILVPGHNYEWIDGSTPNWVTIGQALEHNLALNSENLEEFDKLDFLRFDDDLAS